MTLAIRCCLRSLEDWEILWRSSLRAVRLFVCKPVTVEIDTSYDGGGCVAIGCNRTTCDTFVSNWDTASIQYDRFLIQFLRSIYHGLLCKSDMNVFSTFIISLVTVLSVVSIYTMSCWENVLSFSFCFISLVVEIIFLFLNKTNEVFFIFSHFWGMVGL